MNKSTTLKRKWKIGMFTLSVMTGIYTNARAQTVATFENVQLNANSYYNGKDKAGGFASGNAYFPSVYDTSFGGYWAAGFAASNIKDSTTAGFTNLYGARTATGYNSSTYAVVQNYSVVRLTGNAAGHAVNGFYITNSTYAALSMKKGDSYAKKFGDTTGTHCKCPQGSYPDWFKVKVTGFLHGVKITDSVNFYLADFRDTNNTKDYILTQWKWINLASLGNVDSVQFGLNSSDVGQFGMNTPAFFCMDNFTTADGTTGIATITAIDKTLQLYPNPAKDMLFVNIAANIGNKALLEVYDTQGRLVLQTPAAEHNAVDVSILQPGIYVARLANTGTNVKFVKE